MLYDEPGPFVTRNEPRDATCFANSGLQPTNYKQVRARLFPRPHRRGRIETGVF